MAINKINSKSIEDLQISAADLASGSISTGKIQDNAITGIKIANSIDVTDVNVSGSLGVGTTDPQDKVHIYKGSSGKVGFANNTALLVEDDSNVAIQLSSPSSTNGQILFGDEGSNASGMIQYEHDNDRLGIFTNVSRRISIDSDGIKFGTDTAAANALDDYEEGTWTASFAGSSDTVTGQYTKIGNLVHVQLYSSGINVTSTTGAIISGLPFTVSTKYSVGAVTHNTYAANADNGFFDNGADNFVLIQQNSFSTANTSSGNPRYVMFAGSYQID